MTIVKDVKAVLDLQGGQWWESMGIPCGESEIQMFELLRLKYTRASKRGKAPDARLWQSIQAYVLILSIDNANSSITLTFSLDQGK